MYKRLLPFFYLILFFAVTAPAQDKTSIPSMRRIFHDEIDQTQKKILALDGKDDKVWAPTQNAGFNLQLTHTVVEEIDDIQKQIEADTTLDNENKMKFLRGLNDVLIKYVSGFKNRIFTPNQFPVAVKAYKEAVVLERSGQSIFPVVRKNDAEIGWLLVESYAFQKNSGMKDSRDQLILKDIRRRPDKMMSILTDHPDVSFADSIIKSIAYRNQEELYNYAQSPNGLGKRISEVDDSLVHAISRLAKIKTGRQYFPFLDLIYHGKITTGEIDEIKDEPVKYYKLLVKTEIDYADRRRHGDTPLVMRTLTNWLARKASEGFVKPINDLHEENNPAVRFKVLDQLTAEELYFLPVLTDNEIYTSSYIGIYNKMVQKMNTSSTDTLLMNVKFDHFKKFIRMAANYNTLDDFLSKMDQANAQVLMTAFVNGLERTGDLEDAVDVADSYASISDPAIHNLLLAQVKSNLNKASTPGGRRIYNILNTIFLSKDSSSNAGMFDALGIPPVYFMPNKMLQDTGGRIVVQQFFYGDKGGIADFNSFLNHYKSANWKITPSKEWVTVTSTKGTPVVIYSNRPLETTEDLDAKAQANLIDWLEENNIDPTVVIHRGHSYYANATIQQLAPSAKVVFLGSCGGFHILDSVLNICPQAHIIASKQIGSSTVNEPLLNLITETLRLGKDLNWPQLWKQLGNGVLKKNEYFNDYIAP
ncbi:MAG: hypothetical protein JWN76_949, partial [Chitinophagaceae bacterium]|nr:hypothetical protein [Chitinophagaceae bacterium]